MDDLIQDLCLQFMKSKKNNLEATSYQRYESLLSKYILPSLGAKPSREIKARHILDSVAEWQGKVPAPSNSTIHHARDLLRNILKWGNRYDYLDANPMDKISSDDLPKKKRHVVDSLSAEDLNAVLAAMMPTRRAILRNGLSAQTWFPVAITFEAFTGCRRGEVLALRWKDVHFKEGHVIVVQNLAQPNKGPMYVKAPKNEKSKTVTVDQGTLDLMLRYRETQSQERIAYKGTYENNDLVFATRRTEGT